METNFVTNIFKCQFVSYPEKEQYDAENILSWPLLADLSLSWKTYTHKKTKTKKQQLNNQKRKKKRKKEEKTATHYTYKYLFALVYLAT